MNRNNRSTILSLQQLEVRAVPATVTTNLVRSVKVNGGQNDVLMVSETITAGSGSVDMMMFQTVSDPLTPDMNRVYMDVDLFNHRGERRPNGHFETRYEGSFAGDGTVIFRNMDLATLTGKVPIRVRADLSDDAVGQVGFQLPTLSGSNLGTVDYKGRMNPIHTVRDNARLSVRITGPDIVERGQPAQQLIRVINDGPGVAVRTVLSVTLPKGVTIDPNGTFAGYTQRGRVVTWHLGDLAKSQVEIRVMVIPTANFQRDTTLKIVAKATTKTLDLYRLDNVATKFVQVLGPFTPHLIVSQKNVSDSTAARGQDVVLLPFTVSAVASMGTARPLTYTGSVFVGVDGADVGDMETFSLVVDTDYNGIPDLVLQDNVTAQNGRVNFNGLAGGGYTVPGGQTVAMEVRGVIRSDASGSFIKLGFSTGDAGYVTAKKPDGTSLAGIRTDGVGSGHISVFTGQSPTISFGPGAPDSKLSSIVNAGPQTAGALGTGVQSLGRVTMTAATLEEQSVLGVDQMVFVVNATNMVLQNAFAIQNVNDPYHWLMGEAQQLDGTPINGDTVTGVFKIVFRNILASSVDSVMWSGGSVTFDLRGTVMAAGNGFQASLVTDEELIMRQMFVSGSTEIIGSGLGMDHVELTRYGTL